MNAMNTEQTLAPRALRGCSLATVVLAPAVLTLAVLNLAACGSREIPVSEIRGERVLSAEPATLRESGKRVNGTVVNKTSGGKLLSSIEYRDGFPDGSIREWYPNGQLKIEREVRFVKHDTGGRLQGVGRYRAWCENGTLQTENTFDKEGRAKGEHRSWNCDGTLLSLQTFPKGPVKRWRDLGNGEVVLVEEGLRGEDGQWQGEYRTWHANGQQASLETWRDGAREGLAQKWNEDGVLTEEGSYRAGQQIGVWSTYFPGGSLVQRDYDESNFVDAQYTQAFQQAAGISPGGYGRPMLQKLRFDRDKIDYYVKQGLVDPKKKLNLDRSTRLPGAPFSSISWTYPFIRATPEAAAFLLSLGADPQARDSEQRTRLHHCIYSLRDPSLCAAADVERLLGLGLSPTQADGLGNTPLHDLMHWNNARDTSRMYASTRTTRDADFEPIVQLLLDAGADPDLANKEGETPLMLAARLKRFGVAETLLARSKNPTQLNAHGENLIHLAFQDRYNRNSYQLGADEVMRSFVNKAVARGVDPQQPIGAGETLKTLAERNGAIDFARFLASLSPT